MKIGIITDETDGPPVGMGNTILNIVDKLLEVDKKNEYTLIHRKPEKYDIYSKADELLIAYNYRFPFSTYRNFITLPKILKRQNFDIIHHPCNVGPFVFKSLLPGKKNIETLHDVIPKILPDSYEKTVRFAFDHLLPKILRNVDHIFADSHHSKKDIIKYYKIKKEKVSVSYLAPNENFRPIKKQIAKNSIKKRFKIDFPYVLYVGALEPKKNVSFLIDAFAHLKKTTKLPHKLVLVGKKGWYSEDIFSKIKRYNLQKEVISIGHVDPAYTSLDLPMLYNAADLFVFPSLYEGFGMPPVEAMACGCPVITSNRGSLPEVIGKGGIIIDYFSIEEYSDKMQILLTNKKEKNNIIKKGLKNAKRFSWKNSAKDIVKVYESLF